jgi:hypothetical protein
VSPLAQINNGNASPAIQSPQVMSAGIPAPPPPTPSMGQMAMGMPFQVLPPPPPPPMQQPQQKLSPPQTNGNARKSPQSFDPPPMGYRPEIKIPENPMATLRKVARPQQRDDYWVQEFMQEKARDSLPEDNIRQQIAASPIIQQHQQRQEFVSTPPPLASQSPKPATPISVPSTPQYMQMKSPSPERSEINIPIRNFKLEDDRSASPQLQRIQSPPVAPSSPVTVNKNIYIEPMQQQTRPQQQHVNFQPNQPQGGRIILSTMPNRPQQTQNVSRKTFFTSNI